MTRATAYRTVRAGAGRGFGRCFGGAAVSGCIVSTSNQSLSAADVEPLTGAQDRFGTVTKRKPRTRIASVLDDPAKDDVANKEPDVSLQLSKSPVLPDRQAGTEGRELNPSGHGRTSRVDGLHRNQLDGPAEDDFVNDNRRDRNLKHRQ